jgi:hypothetical protein
VGRVHAAPNAALVINDKIGWNWVYVSLKGQTMGFHADTTKTQYAISIAVNRPKPQNAS